MKKKTFKKMLAGVSAVAMLSTAMPMTLIADAYSSTNLPSITSGFSSLFDYIDTAEDGTPSESSIHKSPLNASEAKQDPTDLAAGSIDLGDYTYKLKKYETATTTLAQDATEDAGHVNYYATTWNTAEAKADLLDMLKDKDVTDVTFYTAADEKSAIASGNTTTIKEGQIKTITINMPVTDSNLVTEAENVAYQPIEFTVVRNAADFNRIAAQVGGTRSIILAANLTSGEAIANAVQLQYQNLDINLNGKILEVQKGIKVTNKTIRLWNGTVQSAAAAGAPVLNTTGSAGAIEIYDKVTIEQKVAAGAQPVISCEEGNILMCGDEVIVKNTGGKAFVGDNFTIGDYNYYGAATVGAASALNKVSDDDAKTVSNIGNLQNFVTKKKHIFNDLGIEVKDRDGKEADSIKYLDADLKAPDLQLAYEPARNINGGTSVVDNTLDDSANRSVIVSKPGQLYWLADASKGSTYDLTVSVAADLPCEKMPETFTPIDASTFKIEINGATVSDTDTITNSTTGRVISGINILSKTADATTGQENAGLIGKTNATKANKISYIGIENATVATRAKEDSYAGVFAGEANNLELLYVYALNPTFNTAQFKGSAAPKFQNTSKMRYSYFVSKYPVFDAVDNGSIALIDQGVNGAASSATNPKNGATVYYDSDLYKNANATQKKLTAATSEEFKKGKVAFMLNKHNPAYADSASDPVAWNKGAANGTCTVDSDTAPYDGDYINDVFGQTLDDKSYPTFLKLDTTVTAPNAYNIATNRVFRQITQDCSGAMVRWNSTNAKFGNGEIDYTGQHKDLDKDHLCDECGGMEIKHFFDESLWPYLSSTETTDYNTTDKNSLDGKFINLETIGNMTVVTFDLRKSKTTSNKTVDEIVDAVNTVNKDGKIEGIKGFDTLNSSYASGSLTAGGQLITKINFIVDDEVICKIYTDGTGIPKDTVAEVGFKVANKAKSDASMYVTSGSLNVGGANSGLPITQVASAEGTPAYGVASESKANVYVAAATTSSGAQKFAVFKSAKTAFTPNALSDYTFVILFSGTKHNGLRDRDNGTLELANGGWNTNGTEADKDTANDDNEIGSGKNGGMMIKTVAISQISPYTGYHKITGEVCGCEWEEECDNEYAITNKGHQGKCKACARVATKADGSALSNGFGTGSNASTDKMDEFEKHIYETMFTSGNLTLKRCVVCGYTTFTREASIALTSDKPELSLVEGDSGNKYRQSYTFQIAAGDDTIVQYGVIASRDADKHIDKALLGIDSTTSGKTDANASKYMFLNTDSSNVPTFSDTQLNGLSKTVKKAISTNGTYTVNASLDNVDSIFEVCGYIVYEDRANNDAIKVAFTPIVKNTFYDAALAEAESACSIDISANASLATVSGKNVRKFQYEMEVSGNFSIKSYGMIYSKTAANAVTSSTDMVAASKDDKITVYDRAKANSAFKTTMKAIKYNQQVGYTTGQSVSGRGYMTVTNPDYGNLELVLYTTAE